MNNLKILRILAILEGISYIALMGICMPIKYIYNIPEATYLTGMAHGILFVAYCIWVFLVGIEKKWSFGTVLMALIASLLPFGTFVADAKIFKNEKYIA